MNVKKLFLIIAALLSYNVFAATERTNNVCFPGWDSVNFVLSTTDSDNFAVTKGQPFSGVVAKSQPKQKYCFAISSGRKNSLSVMDWLNNKYSSIAAVRGLNPQNTPVSAAYYYVDGYVLPNKANFGVYGTLTFEKIVDGSKVIITCSDVLIGQTGNYPNVSGNIWFIYPTATNTNNDHFLRCEDQNKMKQYIYVQADRLVMPVKHTPLSIPEDDNVSDDVQTGIYSSAAMEDNTFRAYLYN